MFIEVYDIECMANLFTYTGYCRTEDKWYQYAIHPLRDELKELINHLKKENLAQFGFNNVNYDYPMLHHLLNHEDEYLNYDTKEATRRLYEKSQSLIDSEFSAVADKNVKIPQVDIYRIHHWDNMARATSLKHCEMAMRMDNIEEMPIPHWQFVSTLEEIQMILDYNKHDVVATNMLLDYTVGKTDHSEYKGKNKLALRQILTKKFKFNLLNHNDVKIGEDLVFKLYAHNAGVPEYLLKKQRTPRPLIHLKDCIPDYVNFKTPKFIKLLNKWKNTSITKTKDALKDSVVYNGLKLDYGTGGLHGSNVGVFLSTETHLIIDADVGLT